jgi:hypothetical protein
MASVVNYISYEHAPGGSKDFIFNYSITVSGTYTAGATGETINLTTALNPNGLELDDFLPVAGLDETFVDILIANVKGYGVGVSAYSAGSFNLFFYSAPGTELTTQTYPASISGGQINVAVRHRG